MAGQVGVEDGEVWGLAGQAVLAAGAWEVGGEVEAAGVWVEAAVVEEGRCKI